MFDPLRCNLSILLLVYRFKRLLLSAPQKPVLKTLQAAPITRSLLDLRNDLKCVKNRLLGNCSCCQKYISHCYRVCCWPQFAENCTAEALLCPTCHHLSFLNLLQNVSSRAGHLRFYCFFVAYFSVFYILVLAWRLSVGLDTCCVLV